MLRLAWLAALVACGTRGEPVATTGSGSAIAIAPNAAGSDAGVPAAIAHAPHGGEIAIVAVTDRGDAAISAADDGDLRFWPSLDGTREPVVLRGRPPVELALAREHDGLIAALRDTAGGVELLHVAADGGVRSRQVVPAEPGYAELAAGETALLARRSDHTIIRLDANAKSSRALAPEMGEQVLAIAARRDVAVAGIADAERPTEINVVREIVLGRELAWGRAFTLPAPLTAPIAISPSGKRIAGMHARNGMGVVIELAPTPRVVGGDVVGSNPEEAVVGFLDDTRAVFRGGVVLDMDVIAGADPWSGTRSMLKVRLGRGSVITDRALVGGHGTHLVIAEPERTQFLGYRDLGLGYLRVTGAQITMGFGNRVLWLDDNLTQVRVRDVANDAAGGLAVDDHRLLKATHSYLDHDRTKLDVSLSDSDGGPEVAVGSFPQGSTLVYEPETHVLAVSGYTPSVARVELDLATGKATRLRTLKTRRDSTVELLDPKQAGGAVAVAYAFVGKGLVVDTFVDTGTSARPLAATSSVQVGKASPLGIDQAGTLYTLASGEAEPTPVVGYRMGKQVRKLAIDGAMIDGTVDRAGTMIAAYSTANLVLYEMDGKERWRVPVWSANLARFTHDGKRLIVSTYGGLLAFDAATGERVATGCGWGFRLWAVEPQLSVFQAPVVCAEAR